MTRARELSKLGNANVFTVDSSNNLGIGSLTPDAKLDVIGIISATSFSGSGANLSGIVAGATLSAGSGAQRVVATSLTSGAMTTAATDADLSWNSTTNILSAPTLSGNITGTAATFSGDVSIGGVLTYEDVTNVDSVGVVTARSGIKVGAGKSISAVSGTLTYYGDGSNLDGVESGVSNFVASGTISNGATVILKDDGTVGIVTQTTGSPEAGTSAVFESSSTSILSAVYDSTNDKVVIAYRDTANYYGYAVVGTVSGTSISFGTAVVFESAHATRISAVYDSTNSKVVIAYRDNDNSDYGTAIVGTVSGTSISFGSAAVFESATVNSISSAYVGSSKVVIAYQDAGNSNYGTAVVGTVSGTSISFGTPVVFESATTDYISVVYDPDNGKVVIVYQDTDNSNYGTSIVGTVSGTSISYGTAVVFESADTDDSISAAYVGSSKVVIAYQDTDNSGYGTAIVGTVSGTSISYGTAVVFESASTSNIASTYDSTNDKVVIAYADSGNSSYGTVIEGTVSGTSISFGTAVVFESAASYNSSCVYDPDNGKVVIAYRDSGNSNYGTAVVFSPTSQVTNLTTENYIGIAGEAISNAATGKVNVIGGTNTGQSGLTTAQTYYVQGDGTLATTAASPSVIAGTSISDTEILVWKS